MAEEEIKPWARNDEKWIAEKNIKFSIASKEDIPDLTTFIHETFYLDEPVHRNIRAMEGNGWVDNYLRKLLDKALIIDPLCNNEVAPASIVARSTVDNSIVGCRIGEISTRKSVKDFSIPPILWITSLPTFLPIPKKITDMSNMIQYLIDVNYGKPQAFDELRDTDQIYFAALVTVSKKARGAGLGTELAERGYEIAKKTGCGYTYVLATSIYSQKIFHKYENWKLLHEVKYEDYKYDKKGRPFLIDPQEHKVIQLLALKHQN